MDSPTTQTTLNGETVLTSIQNATVMAFARPRRRSNGPLTRCSSSATWLGRINFVKVPKLLYGVDISFYYRRLMTVDVNHDGRDDLVYLAQKTRPIRSFRPERSFEPTGSRLAIRSDLWRSDFPYRIVLGL